MENSFLGTSEVGIVRDKEEWVILILKISLIEIVRKIIALLVRKSSQTLVLEIIMHNKMRGF